MCVHFKMVYLLVYLTTYLADNLLGFKSHTLLPPQMYMLDVCIYRDTVFYCPPFSYQWFYFICTCFTCISVAVSLSEFGGLSSVEVFTIKLHKKMIDTKTCHLFFLVTLSSPSYFFDNSSCQSVHTRKLYAQ